MSIITVNYNNCEDLARTLSSIRNQSCKDFEFVVIDGGSTDGSLELIEANKDIIDTWISERDKGIYHAMNKGVSLAKSEYCIFMNAGDLFYHPDEVKRWKSFAKRQVCDIYTGNWVGYSRRERTSVLVAPREVNLEFLFVRTLQHNSTYIKTSILRKYPYSEEYKIVSDWIFFWQAFLEGGVTYVRLPWIVCKGDLGGVSNTQLELLFSERDRYMKDVLPGYVFSHLKGRVERLDYYGSYDAVQAVDSMFVVRWKRCLMKQLYRYSSKVLRLLTLLSADKYAP